MSSRSTGEWLEAIHEQVSRIADHVVGDREASLSALADAEQRNGPLPDVDWETPEELSQKSADSFAKSRTSQDDSDEALAALIEPLLPFMPEQASSLLSLKIARAAREHIEAEQEDAVAFLREEADDQKARAEKAESERDGWKAKYAALRKDVEALRNGYRDRPNDSVSRIHPHAVARHVDWYVLGHDDERVPQPDVTNAPADDPDERVDTEAEQLRVGIKALVEDKSQHFHVTREIPGATVTEYNDPLVRTSRIRALLDQRRDR